LTPLPDSPEVIGTKAAEKVAQNIMPESPEDIGAKAAEKISQDLPSISEGEATAINSLSKPAEGKKDSLSTGLTEMAKDFAKPSGKPETIKKESAIKGISFSFPGFNSPTLGTVVSGLKRKTGLGAK
jgi:hypothetical protein